MSYNGTDQNLDKIRDVILGKKEVLPPHLQEVFIRTSAAFTFMLDSGLKSERAIVKQLMVKFDIAESTGYSDLRIAKILYGDALKATKEAERYIASENSKELYQKAWSMFLATKNIQWFNAAKEQQKLHARINGLQTDDPDMPDPSKINPPIQILQINIDFLTSQFANVIDPKAKEKINSLLEQISELVQQNKIGDYLNTTIDIPHIETK